MNNDKQKALALFGILIAMVALSLATDFDQNDNVFEILVNNTNLAPTIHPELPGTGERINNTLYYANESAREIFLLAHADNSSNILRIDLYINGTRVLGKAVRSFTFPQETNLSFSAIIPKGSSYLVRIENWHHYEWREYQILTGKNGTLSLNQYINNINNYTNTTNTTNYYTNGTGNLSQNFTTCNPANQATLWNGSHGTCVDVSSSDTQTLASVLGYGNVANMNIDMAGYDIINARNIGPSVDNSSRGAFQDRMIDHNGLVGYWDMSKIDNNITIFDKSQYRNHGTWYGNVTPNWTHSVYGSALNFDGINDYVNTGNANSLNFTGAITIEAWVYPSGWGPSAWPRIVDKSGLESSGYSFYLYSFDSSLGVRFAETLFASNSNAVNLNKWQYVAVTANGTHVKFYVDGISVGTTASLVIPTPNTLNMWIGERSGGIGSRSFKGLIDEVRIYNRALSESEISTRYLSSTIAVQYLNTTLAGNTANITSLQNNISSNFANWNNTFNSSYNNHITNISNPHQVTAEQIGATTLSQVNTSALLSSIAQVFGLQGMFDNNNATNQYQNNSITALQGNDTADRAYVNDTFLKLSGGNVSNFLNITGVISTNTTIVLRANDNFSAIVGGLTPLHFPASNQLLVQAWSVNRWLNQSGAWNYGAYPSQRGYAMGFVADMSVVNYSGRGLRAQSFPPNSLSYTDFFQTHEVGTYILQGEFRVNSLAGSGNAYACLDSTGRLYRSSSVCV